MLTDLIIAIVLITVSIILSIYISITKNLNIISGIEPEKIPANKINTVIKIFNTCLLISTILIAISFLFIENNVMLGIIFLFTGVVVLYLFYIYYMKIIKN